MLVVAMTLVVAACSSGGGNDASGAATVGTVRVVNQNLLHGTACPAGSNRCDLPGRVALFLRQLERARCPEIVAIEEGNDRTVTELRRGLDRCGYELVYDDTDQSQDREIVLTTLRVRGSERLRLAGPLRTAYRVRLGSDVGPVDLVATHLASSSDDRPCDRSTCPPPCRVTDSVNTCQARQIVQTLAEDPPSARTVTIVTGDLNAEPDEPTIAALTDAGLVDTHLVIGNAECDPATGAECTSGRVDDSLVDMTNPASKQTERIDYVFLRPIERCTIVRPTGVFAAAGGPTRGDALVFPADHSAVEATVRCRTTAADRKEAAGRLGAVSTTTAPAAEVPQATKDAVTAAFTGLFAPNPDADAQLSHLENGAALKESFLARKAQVGELANKTSVRIDSFDGATDDTVDVTFSLLIDGAVVLDALPGQAKLVDDRWLVATQSYCQVATLGVTDIPEACNAAP